MNDDRDGRPRPDAAAPGGATPRGDALARALASAREAGDASAPLPEGLMARLLADAEARRPAPPVSAARGTASWGAGDGRGRRRRRGRLAGRGAPAPAVARRPHSPGAAGWRTAAGLAACALSGLWLGYAPPAALDFLAGGTAAVPGADGTLSPADLLAPLDGGLGQGLGDV